MTVAALALPDVTMCRGTYPVPVARPYISGQEGVGVVVDAAPGRRELVGRRVAAVTIQPFGSLAPVSVGISTIFEVPDGMTDEDAAGFLIPAHTAYHAAIRRGRVADGRDRRRPRRRGRARLGHRAALRRAGRACDRGRRRRRQGGVLRGARRRRGRPLRTATSSDEVRARRRTNAAPTSSSTRCRARWARVARTLLVPDGRHVLCGHAGGLVPHDPHFYMYNHTLVGATLGSYPRPEMRAHPRRDPGRAARAARGRPLPADRHPVRRVRRRPRRAHRPRRAAHDGTRRRARRGVGAAE